MNRRAEDNLREAYMSIWHHAQSYRPEAGTPMTWMINIVRDKAIDLLRARRQEDEHAVEPGPGSAQGLPQSRRSRRGEPRHRFFEAGASAVIDNP